MALGDTVGAGFVLGDKQLHSGQPEPSLVMAKGCLSTSPALHLGTGPNRISFTARFFWKQVVFS